MPNSRFSRDIVAAISAAVGRLAGLLLLVTLITPVNGRDVTRVIFDVKINDQTVKLAFDTGSSIPLNLWQTTADQLRLKVIPDRSGLAPAPGVTLGITEPTKLVMLGRTFVGSQFYVIPLPGAHQDPEVQGLVGWPFFKDNAVEFKAADRAVAIGAAVPSEVRDWFKLRWKGDSSILAAELPATPGNSEGTLLIDSGSFMGVELSPERWRQWKAAHPRQPVTLTTHFTFGAGAVVQEETWADQLSLNGLLLHDVPVIEADDAALKAGGPDYVATLGLSALRRVDLVVDPKRNLVYLHPRTEAPSAYEHNRLGAAFVPVDERSDDLIAHVAAGSPADVSGIRDGDRLLKINGNDVTQWRVHPEVKIDDPFFESPGTRLLLTLKRGQETISAAATLRSIIGPSPDNAGKYLNLGGAKLGSGDFVGAIADFDQAIALNPNNAAAYAQRGLAREDQGDHSGAIADFTIAINSGQLPGPILYLARAGAKNKRGDRVGAIADSEKALAIDPNYVDQARVSVWYLLRGIVKDSRGDPTGAIADYDKAIVSDATYADAYQNRALAKDSTGDKAGAIADDDRLIALNPNDSWAFGNRAYVKVQESDYNGAIADYSHAIALNPKEGIVFDGRASAEAYIHDYRSADADYDRAVALNPKDRYAFMNRGRVRQYQNDFAGASGDYVKAIELDPRVSDHLRLYLAVCLRRQHLEDGPAGLKVERAWRDHWLGTIRGYLTGTIEESSLLAEAAKGAPESVLSRQCQADYFAGMVHLLQNDREGARSLFQQCIATRKSDSDEFVFASAEMKQLPQP